MSLDEAVGHRGYGGKARDYREFGGKRAFRDTHLLGEHPASGFLNTKFFSVPSFRLSSTSVTCPSCRFKGERLPLRLCVGNGFGQRKATKAERIFGVVEPLMESAKGRILGKVLRLIAVGRVGGGAR